MESRASCGWLRFIYENSPSDAHYSININVRPYLGRFVVTRGRQRQAVVPVEIVVLGQIRADGAEVDVHVLEVAQQVEARGHALPARDGVTLGGGGAHQLEELLRDLEVLLRPEVLPHARVHHALQHILLRGGRLQVWVGGLVGICMYVRPRKHDGCLPACLPASARTLEELKGLLDAVMLEVVDNEVEARLRDHVHEGREHLEGALPAVEDHQVVPHQVVLLHVDALGGWCGRRIRGSSCQSMNGC